MIFEVVMKKIMMFLVVLSVFMFVSACSSNKNVKDSENIEDKIMKAVVNTQTIAGLGDAPEEVRKASFDEMLKQYKEGTLSEQTIDCMIAGKTTEDMVKCEGN